MIKAEIINLTSEFSRHSQKDSFSKIIKKHLEYIGVVSGNIIDLSQRPETISYELNEAISKSSIVITIGGLAAHMNDLAKHSIITNFVLPTEFNKKEYDKLKKLYPNHSDDIIKSSAEYPKGARLFESADISGFALEIKDRIIIGLPSEPLEIYNMFSGQVLPYLAKTLHSGAVTRRTLFPNINITDGANISEQLTDVNVCVNAYKIPEGTVIMATGNEGAVKTTMLACEDFARNLKPKNPLLFSGEGAKQRAALISDREKPKKKWIFVTLLIFFIICGLISASYIGYNYYVAYVNEKNNERLQELLNSQSAESSEISESTEISESSEESERPEVIPEESEPELKMLPMFEGLYAKNDDIAGWIKIEDSKINYPVMKYRDNEFYLKNDFDKKPNKYGVPFIDYENNLEKRDKNTIIYGHNMNDGQMFGELTKYRSTDYYKKHPIVEFSTLYEQNKYKIISAFIANTKPEYGDVFDYHNKINFESQEDFDKFIEDVKVRSFFEAPVDVNYEDNLLTLSTCTYEFNGARFVLVARELREGEDEKIDTDLVKSNEALMPEIWYKTFGGNPPAKYAMKYEESSSQKNEDKIAPSESSSQSSKAEESSKEPSSSESPKKPPKAEDNKSSSTEESSENKNDSSSSDKSSSQGSIEDITPPDLPNESSDTSKQDEESSSEREPQSSEQSSEDSSSQEVITPNTDAMDEMLKLNVNGKNIKMNAYDAVCQAVQNETSGAMHPEALKAQAIATYTYIKYNNSKGIYAQVVLKPNVNKATRDAVSEVLGKTIRYDGRLINSTYHSTSRGKTADSKYVWGTSLPYLVSVDSPYDKDSPYYKNTYTISDRELAKRVLDTYGIDLYETNIHPSDWIYIDESRMDPGGYVGVVEIGGYDKSQGGTVGRGTQITGRNVREKLLSFNLKSTAFDVDYIENNFVFTTYGYGHGVGMSQWGANGMAKDGYTYEEILTHYYKGTYIEDY